MSTPGRLERWRDLEDGSLAGGLGWLAKTLELVGLADEVATSAGRISELVGAMKDYTYMDRAAAGEVDVIAGLENTLTILGHKLKGVSVRREYEEDLPKVQGNGGELNQVWTNLMDNAADAVDGRGNITVRAFAEGAGLVVEVVDDGPGIPREARDARLRALLHDQRGRCGDRPRPRRRAAHRRRPRWRGLRPVGARRDQLHGKVAGRYHTERRLMPMGKTQVFEEICSEKRQVNGRCSSRPSRWRSRSRARAARGVRSGRSSSSVIRARSSSARSL